MKRLLVILNILIFLSKITLAQYEYNIIPQPQKVEKVGKDFFQFGEKTRMSLYRVTNLRSATIINQSIKENLGISTYLTAKKEDAQIELNLLEDSTNAQLFGIPKNKVQEAYHIIIKSGKIILTAYQDKGLYYGALTLSQIIEQVRADKIIPSMKITDWASLNMRGFSDDISRGKVPTVEAFKKNIRQLARYKLNKYLFYIEDLFELKEYPDIGDNRGALAQYEINKIEKEAKKYYIDIIPIIETLGHQEHTLMDSSYSYLAEFKGSMSFCLSCDTIYTFLDNVIKEVALGFSSEYIHIGGRENFEVGLGKSKTLADSIGLSKLYAQHFKKIYEICKKYDKKVMLYGDMILRYPEILESLPKDIIIINNQFTHKKNYPSLKQLKTAEFTFLSSSSTLNNRTLFPLQSQMAKNTSELAIQTYQNGGNGLILSNWHDMSAESSKQLLYPSIAWAGECTWSTKQTNYKTFNENFLKLFYKNEGKDFAKFIYDNLDDASQIINWDEFWRHPLLKPRNLESFQQRENTNKWLESFNVKLDTLQKSLDTLAILNTSYNQNIESLKLLISLKKYFAIKLKTTLILQEYKQSAEKDSTLKKQALASIEANFKSLKKLREDFAKEWITHNKQEGLDFILDKFDRLQTYFEEIKSTLESNQNFELTNIPSKWIYACEDDSTCLQMTTFKTTFTLEEIPLQAYIQVMASTYSEISVNGNPIDTIFVRNFYSESLEYERIKFLNIRQYIIEGNNEIVIKVKNYNRGLKVKGFQTPIIEDASINVYGRVKSLGEEVYIISDNKSWECKNKNGDWVKVTSKPYFYEIVSPNFSTGRTSWIER